MRCGEGGYWAFIPKCLPPDPPLRYTKEIRTLGEEANRALGRLDAVTSFVPDAPVYLHYSYVPKEALLSSQIEGTRSTLIDLLQFEAIKQPAPPGDELQELSNYVAAVDHGLRRLRKDGFPLSSGLIRETHEILLRSGRGARSAPGQFRHVQNWIGGASPAGADFVPPLPEQVVPCMSALERYIHEDDDVPLLIKTGMVHAQFEAIHPFLDGNGRVGRLLITMMLCAGDALSQPLLYLSLYLKTHRTEYFERLSAIRSEGDWEAWIEFFLRGVLSVAGEAADTVIRIDRLFSEHRRLIAGLPRSGHNVLRLQELLTKWPVVNAGYVARRLHVSPPTARKSLKILQKLGLLKELTGKSRDRTYGYMPYINLLAEGTVEAPS